MLRQAMTLEIITTLVLSHARNDSCWEARFDELNVGLTVTRDINPANSNVTEY